MRQIKVCGLTKQDQVSALEQLDEIHMLGFIFYAKSKRYVGKVVPGSSGKKRIAVFVNELISEVKEIIVKHDIDEVQLHGEESPEYCKELRSELPVIKAFGIDETFDFSTLERYEKVVDCYLFDTKTIEYGGSGRSYNWSILDHYQGDVPFVLSGGISINHVKALREFNHQKCIGIDINSGFESSPGSKKVIEIEEFIKKLNHD